MKRKRITLTLLCLAFSFFSFAEISAQDFPSNLLAKVPNSAEKLLSEDVGERTSLLNELVVPVARSCTFEQSLPIDLQKEDYAFVVGKILEKNISELDEQHAVPAWGKLAYLINKFEFKEFARPVAAYLADPNWRTQATAIAILKGLKANEFDADLAKLLGSDNKYIRDETLRVLIEFRSKKAVPTLIRTLSDENVNQRFWAIQKLVEIGSKEAAPEIAQRLQDEDKNIQYWAVDALGKLGAKDQSQELWDFAKTTSAERHKAFAIATLVSLEQEEAVPIVVDQLKLLSKNAIQDNAWEFLDETKPKFLVPTLISLYYSKVSFFADKQDEKKFRWLLLQKLANYRTPLAIPIYRENLVDESDGGRPNTYIASILQELNATEATDDVIALFNEAAKYSPGSDEDYRAGELGIVLAKFVDKKAWKPLLDYVEKTKFYNRNRIISEMNRQVDPKLWEKMHATIPALVPARPVKSVANILSRQTGIPITIENESKNERILCKPEDSEERDVIPCGYADGRENLYNVILILTEMLNYEKRGAYTFIFDKGTVRILTVEKAIEWWRKKV